MSKLSTVKLFAAALSVYAPASSAAILVEKLHASGYIVAGRVSDGYGEYFTNYADLAGKKVNIDLFTNYDRQDVFNSLVNVSYHISDMNVYTYYDSLPGADPANGSYYCGCDAQYDHFETSDFLWGGLPEVKGGNFIWNPPIGPVSLSLNGAVSGSTPYGPVVPTLAGDLQAFNIGGQGGDFIGFSFVLTDVKATLVDLSAVPEPSSWAMMIGGFALVGGAVRRRRVRDEVCSA